VSICKQQGCKGVEINPKRFRGIVISLCNQCVLMGHKVVEEEVVNVESGTE
jgi:hypothetical protein